MRRAAAALALTLWGAAVGAQQIAGARYDGPTDRYAHGVLGDAIEHDTLTVTLSDGRILRVRHAAPLVFEDTEPRLWDVTGDGAPEVVTVEAHQDAGARLVVWGLADGQLRPVARTPFIGTRFRWLAPVAAADLDGDGHVEIAYVDRPHLAKILRIWRYTPDSFTEIASLPGLTNHRIGEDFITGGLRACGGAPELILADADWRRIMSVRLKGGAPVAAPVAAFEGPPSILRALTCD
ncbi:MAG: VCBS repeat-containing protein [Rhodobacteraceae bacterium]|nr:MAG: VCBS repeat-containing protein [Paracoccaceae bacterium]